MTTIKRGFADLPHGQMHYRQGGEGRPLLMLHASPGSSRQIMGLIEEFAKTNHVLAPDTPGNGDSVALFDREPTIVELADAAQRFLDAIGVDKVDLYGSHTGAAIAAELAIAAPSRINAVVLDGVSLMTPEELEDILAHYAFPFPADREGAYLARVFQFCRDQYLFFPWYNRTRGGRRDSGLGSAADIHAWVVEVLKANETYHLNYRAAFKWDAGARLPRLTRPTLLTAAQTDPLLEGTGALAKMLRGSRYVTLPRSDAPDFAPTRAAAIRDFFADHA